LAAARDRFATADLAAGIAAIDASRGDPGASLPWHLDRAADQARARYNAQRSRPPLERPDADRPERRLGAHRLAIAACGEGVVEAIARELEACGRAIGAGRGRALDPPVMRYIAAVDLLSAHRSYPAARVLLDHLMQGAVEGTAWRALQGAVSRSPNAALVDGLLSCIERPATHPSDAVAAAAEVLGLRREREAVPALLQLAGPKANPIARRAAVIALGRVGDRAVADRLVSALDDPGLAEQAALSLLMLGDRRGIDFHGRALAEGRGDLAGSPGEIVGRYGGSSHLLLLVNAADGSDDRALGALQGLGLMGDPRAIPALMKALSSRDRKTTEVASGALQILTGHAEDVEDPGARSRWGAWWEQHGPRLRDGVRHRDGRLFDGGLLLEKMDHPDPWVRRTAYDELVITSGCGLPFDTDGPWRIQRNHLRAWTEWWQKARGRLISGRWYLDGQLIG
jgi:HEAT repeat protein